MNKFFIGLLAFLCIVAITTAAPFNKTDYCGVYPYPQEIPQLPTLNLNLEKFQPMLMDHYSFFRHGDRSHLIPGGCFPNTPQAGRVWDTECPHNTVQMHQGLSERSKFLPLYPIPLHPMPDREIIPGSCHMGQLTQKGAMMSFNNGNRVGRFLNQTYGKTGRVITEKNLQFRVTDVHRTKETAISWITGLLDNLWNVNVNKLPTLFFVDDKVDALKLNTNMCGTAANAYLQEAYASEEYVKYTQEYLDPILKKMREVLKQPGVSLGDVFDCIKTTQCHGHPLPEGLDELAEGIENASNFYWQHGFNFDHRRSSQLFSGVFLIELAQLFTASALKSASDAPRIHAFSGHDFGPMMNLVSALISGESTHWPPYSAMMNIEFYRTLQPLQGETSFVRVLYLGEVVTPVWCKGKLIEGEFCPAAALLEHVANNLPTKEQCPGYPRYDWPAFEQTMQRDLEAKMKITTPAMVQAVDTLFAAFEENYHRHEVKELKTQEPERELSHIERWSRMN